MVIKSSEANTPLNVTCECGKSVPIPDIILKGCEQTIASLKQHIKCLEEDKKFLQKALAEAIKNPPDKNSDPTGDDEQKATLTPAHLRAYQSYQFAESKLEVCTDDEAYKWLKDEEIEDYTLPAFETWQRYVREGRKFHDTQKNTSRKGRTGRSIINEHEIGSLSEVTSQFD